MAEPSRILIVDDEPSITDLLSMALRYEGMEVSVSHLGRDALEAMTTFRPHLVVLDVMLPDLSGFDVLERMGRDRIGGRAAGAVPHRTPTPSTTSCGVSPWAATTT